MRRRCQVFSSACVLAALLGVATAEAAETALIRNRMFAAGGGKELDAAVRIVAIDSIPLRDLLPAVQIAAGTHVIELSCTARVFAGMGTVDFDSRSTLTVDIAAGRTYQLDAQVSVRGDCTPVLE